MINFEEDMMYTNYPFNSSKNPFAIILGWFDEFSM